VVAIVDWKSDWKPALLQRIDAHMDLGCKPPTGVRPKAGILFPEHKIAAPVGSWIGGVSQDPSFAELTHGYRRVAFISPGGEHLTTRARHHAVIAKDWWKGGEIDPVKNRVLYGFLDIKSFRAFPQILVIQALDRQDFPQWCPAPPAFSQFAIETEPPAKEHQVRSGFHRFHGEAVRSGKVSTFVPKSFRLKNEGLSWKFLASTSEKMTMSYSCNTFS